MTSADTSQKAQEWSTYLLGKTLPTPFKVGNFVLEVMESKMPSYHTLANQLSQDPVLSFKLMQAASQQGSDNTEYSKTLDHAMSMIGVEQVQSNIRAMPNEADSNEDVAALYYKKILARSLYAAHLARAIAEEKGQFNSNELYWSGLFVYTPLWYLWRFATTEMRLLTFGESTKHKSSQAMQEAIFSCTIEAIAGELCQSLALPPLVKYCYQPEHQLSPRAWGKLAKLDLSRGEMNKILDSRELKLQVQHPSFVIQLVKLISDASMHCWYSRATERGIRLLACYLNISEDKATRMCHEFATEASRAHPMSGIFLPATRLFLPPYEFVKAPSSAPKSEAESKAEATSAAQTQTSPNSSTNSDIDDDDTFDFDETSDIKPPSSKPSPETIEPNEFFNGLATKMYKHPDEFSDVHELFNATTNALVYGLGIRRASISLFKHKEMLVKTHYSSGCQEHPELANFEMPLVKGTLFSRLAAKTASVWLQPSSEQHMLDLVPSNFKQVTQCDNFLMMSIFVNDRPFALV